jgi:hypothetical protein
MSVGKNRVVSGIFNAAGIRILGKATHEMVVKLRNCWFMYLVDLATRLATVYICSVSPDLQKKRNYRKCVDAEGAQFETFLREKLLRRNNFDYFCNASDY